MTNGGLTSRGGGVDAVPMESVPKFAVSDDMQKKKKVANETVLPSLRTISNCSTWLAASILRCAAIVALVTWRAVHHNNKNDATK